MSTTPRDRHDPRGTTSPDATGPAPRTQAGETAQAPATAPGRPAAPDPLSDYVAQVRAHLGAAAPALAEDLTELDASLRETADSQGYQTALAAYGPAADYAAALRGSRAADDQADRPGERPPVRRVLGVPTALSPRGLVHRAARSFSPADPLLVPRAYGIGWDVNLGALAVRAGLAHPDDLDDDLDLAPAQMTALSLVPALLALGVAATGTHWAPRGPRQGRAGRAPADGRGPAVALLPPALAAAALGAVDVLGGASLPQRLGHAVTSVLLTGVGVAGALQRRPGASSARLTQAGVVAAAGALAGGAAVLTLRAAVHRAVHAQRPPAQSTRS